MIVDSPARAIFPITEGRMRNQALDPKEAFYCPLCSRRYPYARFESWKARADHLAKEHGWVRR